LSADLAESTNIVGFAKDFGELKGYGWYDRNTNPDGALLPQPITEFANSGIAAGIATVNFSPKPFENFNGFIGACSTYGSFSYLKYGLMRLFSQLAQDSEIKVGTRSLGRRAQRSRDGGRFTDPLRGFLARSDTAFSRRPRDRRSSWEHNEVPVVIAAALRRTLRSFPFISPARDRHTRPQGAGDSVSFRGGKRGVRDASVS